LDHLGNSQAAIDSYDQALRLNPNSDRIWYSRGMALSRIGKREDAIASLEKAIELNPNLSDAKTRHDQLLSD
ncbi:tetratricopeptide repeat protein, partial [Pseudanabaenaceae cyanobacterium LEGE 13415]|nr:tetratricopeptide repeat protein [Pseudanabaenaceae cyanobacterium LEGE 13415]